MRLTSSAGMKPASVTAGHRSTRPENIPIKRCSHAELISQFCASTGKWLIKSLLGISCIQFGVPPLSDIWMA